MGVQPDLEALREELVRPQEPWKPDPGDVLVGTVVDVSRRAHVIGEGQYPVVSVLDERGVELLFHAYHAVAKDEVARLQPQPGDTIGVAYLGKHPEKEYERYRLKVIRNGAAPDPELAELRQATIAEGDVEPGGQQTLDTADDIPF